MARLTTKKVGIATMGNIPLASSSSESISDQDIYDFVVKLPLLNGILPRMRKGSQLITQGLTHWKGEKIRAKANYLMDAETLSIQFHMNKLRILKQNPNFGFAMMQEYKSAVLRDYNSGIKVKI